MLPRAGGSWCCKQVRLTIFGLRDHVGFEVHLLPAGMGVRLPGSDPDPAAVVPFIAVPPNVARLDRDDVWVRVRNVDDDGTLDLLVITNDWLVQGETDPLVEALRSDRNSRDWANERRCDRASASKVCKAEAIAA